MSEPLKKTRVFRFDQMAVQVKDKIDNPADADVDRYVGLEHIDPESLKIRRWGKTTDVESSKFIFKSGDIIFGKRRAYQRKLAVADFDGICSAHAMVLRPKIDVVLEEILPFFMQSDIFMGRAVKISVGGLSPTINWRDLAKEEFALPPLEEQRRIAETLQAASQLYESLSTLVHVNEKLLASIVIECVAGRTSPGKRRVPEEWKRGRVPGIETVPAHWKVVRLTDVAKLESGHTPSKGRPDYWDGDIPWVSLHDTAALDSSRIDSTAKSITKAGLANSSARLLPEGTVLVSRTASVGHVTVTGRAMATSQDFANYICDPDRLSSLYLYYVFRGMGEFLRAIAGGSTHKTVYLPFFEQLEILLPPLEEQVALTTQLESVEARLNESRARLASTSAFKSRLVNNLVREWKQ